MSSEENNNQIFEGTPTWSLSIITAVLLILAVVIQLLLGATENWLHATNRRSLMHVVKQTKEELLIIGLMSLFLKQVSQPLSKLCVPDNHKANQYFACSGSFGDDENPPNKCTQKNHKPLVTYEALEELHRFIFVLCLTNMTFAYLSLLFAKLKTRRCRQWEEEAHLDLHQERRVPRRNAFCTWMTSFFHQFSCSLGRAEYLTLRWVYITHHNLPPTFDFNSFVVGSIEQQFHKVITISWPLRVLFPVFMLLNTLVYNPIFYLALAPVILVPIIGMKLQHIVATSVQELAQPTFWFNKPELFLYIIYFIQFQFSFSMASFLWFWWLFGIDSCMAELLIMIMRLIVGFAAHFLSSYTMFPTYVVVAQMNANPEAAEDSYQQQQYTAAPEDGEEQQLSPTATIDIEMQQQQAEVLGDDEGTSDDTYDQQAQDDEEQQLSPTATSDIEMQQQQAEVRGDDEGTLDDTYDQQAKDDEEQQLRPTAASDIEMQQQQAEVLGDDEGTSDDEYDQQAKDAPEDNEVQQLSPTESGVEAEGVVDGDLEARLR